MTGSGKPTILITGGAGYIGSHTVLALRAEGRQVVVVDDLSSGRMSLLPPEVRLIVGDIADGALMRQVMREHGCGAVLHFAGSIVIPESVDNPLKYYRNNTCASRELIAAAVDAGVQTFIFSSTAAVYGMPVAVPIGEDAPLQPINPYGWSKLMTETMLRDAAPGAGMSYGILRYFNVAGADPEGRSGQCGAWSTHLIKIAAETVVGRRPGMTLFGNDYDTPDGTCVRDYIHVSDLASAHVRALDHLTGSGESLILNCGYGRGYSVQEVLSVVEQVAGRPLAVTQGPRRPGDAAVLVADAGRIRKRLGWEPRHDDLEEIVRSAIEWEKGLRH